MNEKEIFNKRDDVLRQLNNMDLTYEDLDTIQLFLINNSYTPLGDLVFKKEDLKDEEFIFYMDSKELYECVEKGNGKIDKEYCQFYNDGIWFYSFDKIKDIVLNYMLYDSLFDLNINIIAFLINKFNISY